MTKVAPFYSGATSLSCDLLCGVILHLELQPPCSSTLCCCSHTLLMLYCAQTSLVVLWCLLVNCGHLIWCKKVCSPFLGAFLHFLHFFCYVLIEIFSPCLCSTLWSVRALCSHQNRCVVMVFCWFLTFFCVLTFVTGFSSLKQTVSGPIPPLFMGMICWPLSLLGKVCSHDFLRVSCCFLWV
jgi:hypothetical protein